LLAELSRAGTARVPEAEARKGLARSVLDRMVDEELLFQSATTAGATVDAHEVQRLLRTSAQGYPAGMFSRVLHSEQLTLEEYVERVRRKALVDKFLKERFDELPEPDEAEIRARWEKSAQDRPPAVHARQLLVKTEEEAKHLLSEIEKGSMTLADAARGHSVAPEREEGGDLGWFSRGEMPPVFDACFNLEPGKVSGVVPSEYGFHLFQVIDKRAGGKEPLEHARRRVEAEVKRERQEQALLVLTKKLRTEAKIEINDEALALALAQLPDATDVEERGPDAPPEEMQPTSGEKPAGVIDNLPKAKELPEKYKKWRDKRRAERKAGQQPSAEAAPAEAEAAPAEASPAEAAPAESAPAESAPAESPPAETAPAEETTE
jgi:parvulin-like peptidyl-prolyl isomerase